MTGAVALAGMAALRGGAGLVRLAVADACLDVVAGIEPSYMTSPLPSDRAGRIAYRRWIGSSRWPLGRQSSAAARAWGAAWG